MVRFRRNSRRFLSRPKRNCERVIRGGTSTVTTGTQQIAYTWTATDACTVRSIKLDVGCTNGMEASVVRIPYVLVRVPEGYNANSMTYPALAVDLYNPTDLVLISGILTENGSEDHKFNMIGRKMKAGDRLALIFLNFGNVDIDCCFEISFSVMT